MSFTIASKTDIQKWFSQAAGVDVISLSILIKATAIIIFVSWAGFVIGAIIKDRNPDDESFAYISKLVFILAITTTFVMVVGGV